MRLRLAFAALAAAAVPVLVAPAHPAEAQAQRDWSRTVALTPEGGVRMGNPEAKVETSLPGVTLLTVPGVAGELAT